MKKLLSLAIMLHLGCAQALGPGEINFNGQRFYKNNEKFNGSSISAEYAPVNRSNGESIVITHVLDKNEPSKVIKNLRTKKSVEIVEVANGAQADMLVSFIKFDTSNNKVQNNVARIKPAANNRGSVVFQYIETQRSKSHADGNTFPDYTTIAENMKQIPIEKYTSTGNERFNSYDRPRYRYQYRNHNVPWYKRQDAHAGPRGFSFFR